ncbi:hypothetical protein [Nocardiopsis ansamitocini]|uniref:Uncharacterized protein n=1 Tax=Nocardiopsis ansamitocini TaxID=1670832 RepID=A0A9W6P6X0_9ACTN|nr:hypothetical protein [Nocardiopsis ansamitocini]GLU48177.1 hypothetical protein Nans01_25280 [Nocardiopsis ansamitocini]
MGTQMGAFALPAEVDSLSGPSTGITWKTASARSWDTPTGAPPCLQFGLRGVQVGSDHVQHPGRLGLFAGAGDLLNATAAVTLSDDRSAPTPPRRG